MGIVMVKNKINNYVEKNPSSEVRLKLQPPGVGGQKHTEPVRDLPPAGLVTERDLQESTDGAKSLLEAGKGGFLHLGKAWVCVLREGVEVLVYWIFIQGVNFFDIVPFYRKIRSRKNSYIHSI